MCSGISSPSSCPLLGLVASCFTAAQIFNQHVSPFFVIIQIKKRDVLFSLFIVPLALCYIGEMDGGVEWVQGRGAFGCERGIYD